MKKQAISLDTFTAAAQYWKAGDYWMQKLSGELIKCYFPYDNSKSKTPHSLSSNKDAVSICFPGEVFSRLMKLSRGHDYTLHMIAAAVVVVLLDKYSDNDNKDIIVGVPIYRHVIGPDTEFINTVLALRVGLHENITFKELLLQVRQTLLEADKNKNYPLEVLMSRLNMAVPEHDFPLFDVAVLLENIHDIGYLDPVSLNMIFCLRRMAASVELEVQYNASRYEQATVRRIAGHFSRVLQQALFNVDMPLAGIDMTPEEEKKLLLKDFNDTAAEFPHDKTIHELFAEQAKRIPNHIAAVGAHPLNGNIHLTYKELDKKSGQLARVLREKGVEPDIIVGIMIERSVEMVVGLLGILKAGGAYLPIDPDYPPERKRYMLADCNAAFLLTARELADVCTGTACRGTACRAPTNLAYVIYTSGSTGKSKGVAVEQQNVVRLVKNTNYIEFSRNGRLLQTGALAFDASTFEIWGSLLNGLTLCLVPEEDILSPGMLKQDIGKYGITIMWLTSSLFNYLSGEDTGIFGGLKNLLVGGDVLSPPHINRVRSRYPGLNIINGYGPTENTTFSTTYLITGGHEERIPIGRPIANSTAYILDRNRNPVPVGVVGELYVGGRGVSRGYLNNPELTAGKFVSIFSEKIYKTGDLARWLADGNIEFLGRKDFQVKIRGFRIEPGEIESRLLEHPQVKEAVVVVREEESGDKYLCAYIVGHEALAVPELRDYLSGDFPDYMIPSYFVLLEKMPLTVNGKVDRAALPVPERGNGAQSVYNAPGNQLEQTLVNIWSDILGLAPGNPGIDANFFEVGGHSLKATMMIAQVHQELNVKIPLTQVFLTPTIRGLAQYITGLSREQFTAVPGAEDKNYYGLSSAQKRLYVLQQLDKEGVGYNMPMAVGLAGELDKQRLEKAFRALIHRHESLRTSFEMIRKEPVQRIHDDVEFEIEYHSPGQDMDFVHPFDLTRAPLFRVGLMEEEEGKYILWLDMHHIVSDGTSMGILVNDFTAFYSGRELSKLRIQYKDFSGWQNRMFQSPVMMKQEAYWLGQFGDEIPVLSLPGDYPRPGVLSFAGAGVVEALGNKTAEALRQLALKTETTLFMVLTALYNILLSRISGGEDIMIGTPIAGRNHADLREVVGMFVNTLVLRNYPRGPQTFIQFLGEVKRGVLGALENQDYPFEKLVERLSGRLERNSGRNPLFDTMFTLETVDIPGMQIPGLELKPYAFENKIAKFDLSFTASETGEDLLLGIDYSTKLFKKETVQRFLRYFKAIATSVSEHPRRQIREIQFLAGEERQQLLVNFNDSRASYVQEKTVCQLFAEQVSRTPDSVAVIGLERRAENAGQLQITYGELNKKADRLAVVLKKRGVHADDIVAIMAERSLEMVMGITGILKSGAAYLPIDPGYPRERVDYMLKDSNAGVLVSELGEVSKVREGTGVVKLDELRREHPAHLCYIIYTSGSTGRPKGVGVTHRNVVNYLDAFDWQFDLQPADIVVQQASYAFDAFVEEMYPILLKGGVLAIPSREEVLDVQRLVDFMTRHQVTMITCSPLMLGQLNQHPAITGTAARIFISGGDRLKSGYIDNLLKIETAGVYNTYGPTETTVCATYYRVTESDGAAVPIGKPIPGYRVYILDRHGQLQPMGVPGEMCIGGEGLARGYLNRPELTAEKFISAPASSSSSSSSWGLRLAACGCRLYRTGDLARWLGDGNIEFLGRMDSQVKIRGYRIELGEIESCLLKHPRVKEAVVLSRSNNIGTQFLCAYFTGAGTVVNPPGMAGEFKNYLSQSLPDYMIPAYFLQVEKIPVTANGKIDGKALPQPVFQSTAGYIVPETLREKGVAGTWREILAVENVGIDDNFFELGGNSLNIIQLGARLKEALQIDVPTVVLFRFPTIRTFLGYLQEQETVVPVDKIEKEKEREKERVRSKSVDRAKRMMKGAINKREGRKKTYR